jgi:CRP-like cAMP-binding protein
LTVSELTDKEFDELSHAVVDKTFDAGETIFQSMEPNEAALYIVREGTIYSYLESQTRRSNLVPISEKIRCCLT